MLNIQKKLNNPFLAYWLCGYSGRFCMSTQIAALSWILSKKYGLDIHEVAFVWLAYRLPEFSAGYCRTCKR
jgi:hypothetical protein